MCIQADHLEHYRSLEGTQLSHALQVATTKKYARSEAALITSLRLLQYIQMQLHLSTGDERQAEGDNAGVDAGQQESSRETTVARQKADTILLAP